MPRMAMGTREDDQPPLWIATSDLPVSPGHPFYTRLNAVLDAASFDRFVDDLCRRFYAPVTRVWSQADIRMGNANVDPDDGHRVVQAAFVFLKSRASRR